MSDDFPSTTHSRLTRRADRGTHDKQAVFDLLDSALVCHIAYVVDGQPYATPTLFWREGETLYWHGSAHGKMIRAHAAGQRVCVTVAHLDALNLGRSGIASSVQYRSVMAFGSTRTVADPAEKRRQMCRLIDRQFPNRSSELRPIHDSELDQILVIEMPIEEASAKTKAGGIAERSEADYEVPTWAGFIPVPLRIGEAVPDQRLLVGTSPPDNVAPYSACRSLEEALHWAAEHLPPG